MQPVTYQMGSACIALSGTDPATMDFADAFFARCEHGDDAHRLLGRIVLQGGSDPPDGRDPVVVRRHGDDYLVSMTSLGGRPDLGDVASVLRKLARELWLANVPTDTYYLHASAVDNGRQVVVFAGDKRAGKTTLMLDAVMHHGYSLLTNDGLLLCRVRGELALAPLPTLAKIRRDTARHSQPWLEAAASKDPFNAAQYRHWLANADAEDDNRASLYLTFGALGHPFREVRLSDRTVTFVDARFAAGETATSVVVGSDPRATLRLLRAHRKPFVAQFADAVDPRPPDEQAAAGLLGQVAGATGCAAFAHHGRVAPLLDALPTEARPRPARPARPAARPEPDRVSATAAAVAVARHFGARVDEWLVLRTGSNVTVLLKPQMLVAKVARTRRPIRRTPAWFDREVAVARYLQSAAVPAARPASSIPPGPHRYGDQLLSFWDWIDVSGSPPPPDIAGRALRGCHRALAGYTPCGEEYDPCAECDEVLAVTPSARFLVGERELLAALAPRCFAAVREWTGPVQPLHGDPTTENLLRSGDGYVWCDFEDTYVGSVWWDMACLLAPATVAGDGAFVERALGGYGTSTAEPAVPAFVAARVMHSAIWSAYVNTPGPSRTRLRRLAWLEQRRDHW